LCNRQLRGNVNIICGGDDVICGGIDVICGVDGIFGDSRTRGENNGGGTYT